MDINDLIRKKAFGIMQSIEIMNEKERLALPSRSYADNYDGMRDLCLDENPLLERLMPPKVKIKTFGWSNHDYNSIHTFAEIHTFCSEIYHLLE
jgi:uncharacterized membrane protein YagU involved in acid resistance